MLDLEHRAGNDDYTQPDDLFRLMSDSQKQQLFDNIAAAMQRRTARDRARQLGHFAKTELAYAASVAKAPWVSKADPRDCIETRRRSGEWIVG